jgi:hypothetical protein
VVDQGIKKATVLKEDLPSFNANNLGYFVRYRIVSADKNRSSHWSPYYLLIKGIVPKVPCSVTVTGTSLKVINMVWQHPKISEAAEETEIAIFKEYDIYIRTNRTFDPLDIENPLNGFINIGSSSSTQFSTLMPSDISWFQVAVQVPVYPKAYSENAAIFTSSQASV